MARSGKRKSFAGFDQFVLLSSGVASNFIELCKYTFFFALSEELPLKEKTQIPEPVQNDAVYLVSQRLRDTIDGNVQHVGPHLLQLINDLGAILRTRLLHHPSEPEANRIAINNFNSLKKKEYKLLSQVLAGAITWSIFHLEGTGKSFKPKNIYSLPSVNLVINRVLCPALEISPRARWRVQFKLDDLNDLLKENMRESTFKRLSVTLGASDKFQENLFQTKTEGIGIDKES